MDGRATKCDFPKYHCKGLLLYYKSIEDIITKFKLHGFQIIKINRKKFGGSGNTPSYSCAQDLPHLTLALFEASWRYTGVMRRVANAEAG